VFTFLQMCDASKMFRMDFRCEACEKTKGFTRPHNCAQIVKVTCTGPKIPKELAEARARVAELERAVERAEAERSSSIRQKMEHYCQCCGCSIKAGGECGC
jgi:hypothetical protein